MGLQLTARGKKGVVRVFEAHVELGRAQKVVNWQGSAVKKQIKPRERMRSGSEAIRAAFIECLINLIHLSHTC